MRIMFEIYKLYVLNIAISFKTSVPSVKEFEKIIGEHKENEEPIF